MASACCRIRQWIKPDHYLAQSGSLAAIPFWYLMTFFPWQLYSLVVMLGICIGVYLCHQTAKDMGVHDHGSIVWDEFIGMWITLMALPRPMTGSGSLPDSVIFRILDMWKPSVANPLV
ncbi:phosphatidylglycerophosphatase A [Escherichia coli]